MDDEKYWVVRDYEQPNGNLVVDEDGLKLTSSRSPIIRKAPHLLCGNISLIDSHGSIEVIKFRGEMIAHV